MRATTEASGDRGPYGGQKLGVVLGWCGFIQYSAHLLLFTFGQRRRAGSLGLEESAEKDPVVHLGAGLTEIAMIDTTPHVLRLEDLSFPFSTALAQHATSIPNRPATMADRVAYYRGTESS
jgi:hypothetical protein